MRWKQQLTSNILRGMVFLLFPGMGLGNTKLTRVFTIRLWASLGSLHSFALVPSSLQRTFHVQMIPLCARVLRTLLVDILWSLNSLLFPKGSLPQASIVFNGGEESFVRPGRMNQGRKRAMCAHWPLALLLILALCPHWHFCPGRRLFKLWTMRQGKPQACLWAGC